TRNLEALLPAVTPTNASQFMFCTDDKNVEDLLAEGHIDYIIRKAIAGGLHPAVAVRLATLNTAEHFGLHHTRAIAPGHRADVAVMSDWQPCRVTRTLRNGVVTAENGVCTHAPGVSAPPVVLRSTINIQTLEAAKLAIPLDGHAAPRVHI